MKSLKFILILFSYNLLIGADFPLQYNFLGYHSNNINKPGDSYFLTGRVNTCIDSSGHSFNDQFVSFLNYGAGIRNNDFIYRIGLLEKYPIFLYDKLIDTVINSRTSLEYSELNINENFKRHLPKGNYIRDSIVYDKNYRTWFSISLLSYDRMSFLKSEFEWIGLKLSYKNAIKRTINVKYSLESDNNSPRNFFNSSFSYYPDLYFFTYNLKLGYTSFIPGNLYFSDLPDYRNDTFNSLDTKLGIHYHSNLFIFKHRISFNAVISLRTLFSSKTFSFFNYEMGFVKHLYASSNHKHSINMLLSFKYLNLINITPPIENYFINLGLIYNINSFVGNPY